MTDHPITPPPELVEQWFAEQRGLSEASRQQIATRAVQWAADQELDACCSWLQQEGWSGESRQLRAARRPEPLSLKKQALAGLMKLEIDEPGYEGTYDTIRRALEQLDD